MAEWTQEKILAMEPGRELDALVAEKVMGWHRSVNGTNWMDGEQFAKIIVTWHPSKDISAAWEVLEKFKTHQITKSGTGFSHSDMKYRVIVGKNQNVAYANVAPEAICKAALLAVMDI